MALTEEQLPYAPDVHNPQPFLNVSVAHITFLLLYRPPRHHSRSTALACPPHNIIMAASGSGFQFSQDETRRTLLTSNTNGDSTATAFFSGGSAAIASGGSWAPTSHGAFPSHPWAAQPTAALPAAPDLQNEGPMLPTPPVPVVLPPRRGGTPAGRAATPPSGPSAPSARRPRNARRAARVSTAVPRSCSPAPPGSTGPVRVELAPGTDGEDGELGVGDVLGMVKRSFATVRAALTEQRGKVDDMARQIAAGMSKVDHLAVLVEQSMTARVADRATLEGLRERADEIMEQLIAAGPSQGPAVQPQEEEEEDSFAWVGDLRVSWPVACEQREAIFVGRQAGAAFAEGFRDTLRGRQ